jgi:hypothetical protein
VDVDGALMTDQFKTPREAFAHCLVVGVPLQIRTRASIAWIKFCMVLQHFVGEDRAARWAEVGAWRLARYRIGAFNGRSWGRWQRFAREGVADAADAAKDRAP